MKSQKGNMAIIIGVIIVILIAVGSFAAFHKSAKTTTTTQSNSSSNASSSPKPTSTASIIQTKTNSKVGQYLADANNNALYTYGGDGAGVSNCSGSCLYSWPIYQAQTSSSTLPSNVTIITRSDGAKQYAYKGMPLYTFSGDTSGQVTGDGVSNFHIAKP